MINYFLMPHPPIIIPEVGKGEENKVINTVNACRLVGEKIEELEAETIIIISPHGAVFRDAVSIITSRSVEGDLRKFGVNNVSLNYEIDLELTNKIIDYVKKDNILVVELDEKTTVNYNIPLELDHGAIVPLYYADKARRHKLVHINYGFMSPIEFVRFGMAIKEAVNETNKNVILIASGDLSHRLTKDGPYEYTPLGGEFDNTLVDILSSGNLDELFNIDKKLIAEAGECGLRSLYILAGAIGTVTMKSDLFSYEGPLGVGYAIFQFEEGTGDLYSHLIGKKENEHKRRIIEGNPYTKLARKNLVKYFTEGKIITVDEIVDKELLNDKKGVFVSLKLNGELRGCIGTIEPTTQSVAEEIIRNSLSAALNDPRFQPLREDELKEVDISVDLLYPAEKTTFENLDPKNYGVIVSSGYKKGLLLPNLEGVDTAKQQVEIAMNKGGITNLESYELERFKVERFKEVEDDE